MNFQLEKYDEKFKMKKKGDFSHFREVTEFTSGGREAGILVRGGENFEVPPLPAAQNFRRPLLPEPKNFRSPPFHEFST